MLSSNLRHETWRVLKFTFVILTVVPVVHAGFVPIAQPDAAYLSSTALLPITAPDFDVVNSLSAGTFTVSFDTGLVALTVPTTWSSWGSPPDVESATPRVLWTNGNTSLTLALSEPVHLFGVEAQPNTSVPSAITASFFLGASLVGEIGLDVDGNAAARLFAASSTTPFDTIEFSSTDDFAIAQIRTVPEPSSLAMLATGMAGVLSAARRDAGGRAPRPAEMAPA